MTGDSNTDETTSAVDDKEKAPDSTVKLKEEGESSGQTEAEAIPVVETTNNDKINNQMTSSKTSKLFFILPSLVTLATILAIAYFFWQQSQAYQLQQQEQQQRIAALEEESTKQLDIINRLTDQQGKETSKQQDQLKQIQKTQSSIQQRLDSHNQRIRSLTGTSREDWLLAESRYLLRLASQRLLVENSTEGAQALLQAADKILDGIDDNELLPVRTSIANEIIALKLAKTVDKQGIYAGIDAIKDQLKTLPSAPYEMKFNENNPTKAEIDETEDKTSFHPWKSVKKMFGHLDRYIVIKHEYDEVPDLLYSEQEQKQIRNNMLLMLEQAQFALLHEEADIYQRSLSQVLKWWNTHFIHYEQQEVLSVKIKSLLEENIIVRIPAIDRSAKLLSDYIDRFHTINPPTANPTQ